MKRALYSPLLEAGAHTNLVTAEQRAQFDRDGYFIIEDLGLAPETFDQAVADFEPLLLEEEHAEEWSDEGVFYTSHRIMDAWKISEPIKAIATAPRVLGILAELYGRKPLPFQTLNFKMPTQQRAHSDTIHFNSMPPGFMAGVWVALEDVDMDNGAVAYYAGSHRWKEVALPDVDAYRAATPAAKALARLTAPFKVVRDTMADYLVYEDVIQASIDRAAAKPTYATIRKGQAFIWAANLLHGGSPQRDRNRTRLSQVTHYFFEGCRYYTPLLQRGFRTAWRTPSWIE